MASWEEHSLIGDLSTDASGSDEQDLASGVSNDELQRAVRDRLNLFGVIDLTHGTT